MPYVQSELYIVRLCFNLPAALTALALASPGDLLGVFSAALYLQCCTFLLLCARLKSIDSVEWGKKGQPRAQQRKSDRTSGRQKDHRVTKQNLETAATAVAAVI